MTNINTLLCVFRSMKCHCHGEHLCMTFLHQLLRVADNSIILPGIMEDIILLIIAGQKQAVLFGFPDQLLSAPIQNPDTAFWSF